MKPKRQKRAGSYTKTYGRVESPLKNCQLKWVGRKSLGRTDSMTWNYEGNFNELAALIKYGITMKYLVAEGREDELTNAERITAAAKEIDLTDEKIADAMINAGQKMKEVLEINRDLEAVVRYWEQRARRNET